MADCVIFCAGEFDRLLCPIENALVIAADGGLRHTQALGIAPDVVLGDFDSLGYVPQNATVFPVEKDDTDAMLAVRHGLARNCRDFLIYGGLEGKRLDHTVANLQTLQFLADRGAKGWLIGKDQVVTVVRNGGLSFLPGANGILSLFCMGADARGVTLEGFQYPLTDGDLSAGFPLGVSNHFTGAPGRISVREGSLLVILSREDYPYCEDRL